MANILNTRIKFKRDIADNYSTSNPVLLNGEIVLVDQPDGTIDMKIGDGESFYDSLPFWKLATNMIEAIYPVGSIYISTVSVNPATLFGVGTWEQIQDRFLLAAGSTYSAGETGGEATHTLTSSEMPKHTHTATTETAGAHTHKIGTDKDVAYIAGGSCWSVHAESSGATYVNGYTDSAGGHTHPVTVNNTGSGAAHNNMPPYLTVYVWKRTA